MGVELHTHFEGAPLHVFHTHPGEFEKDEGGQISGVLGLLPHEKLVHQHVQPNESKTTLLGRSLTSHKRL